MGSLVSRRRFLALFVTSLVVACRGTTGGEQGTTVNVELGEYFVKPDKNRVAPGKVRFVAKNVGTMEHELIVLRTDLAADALPVNTAEDKAEEEQAGQVLGEIEPEDLPPGKSAEMTLDLTAGHYVLLCNIKGHYRLGMHTDFSVQ